MSKRGISLKIDDTGSVAVVIPEEGELCCGIKICSKCKEGICQAAKPPQQALILRACPLKKWVTLWTAPRHGETNSWFNDFPKDCCQTCGSKDKWRLLELKTTTGKKKGDWTCSACHPPSDCLKVERQNNS
jgi:hypothetical protein